MIFAEHYARDDFCWDAQRQVPGTAALSECETSGDEEGACRVTETSEIVRGDSSILSINRCRMSSPTRSWSGGMLPKQSARPGSPSARVAELELALDSHVYFAYLTYVLDYTMLEVFYH